MPASERESMCVLVHGQELKHNDPSPQSASLRPWRLRKVLCKAENVSDPKDHKGKNAGHISDELHRRHPRGWLSNAEYTGLNNHQYSIPQGSFVLIYHDIPLMIIIYA